MIFRETNIAAAVLVAIATATPASADTGPRCGDTITSSVTLTRNLVCRGTALTITHLEAGKRLRINFAGHSIKGDGTGVGIAVTTTRFGGNQDSGVDLTDGTIRGFSSALFSTARIAPGPGDLTLTRMKFVQNEKWVSLGDNDDIDIRDSQFIDTGLGGPGTDSTMTITNSKFVRSGLIAAHEGNTYIYNSRMTGGSIQANWLVAVGNTITSCNPSAPAGITAAFGSARIQGNTVARCGTGIHLLPLERPGVVEGNTLSHNLRDGMHYETLASRPAVTITGNRFSRNGGNGLHGSGDGPVTITANSAVHNSGHGVHLVGSLVTDGGGNTARRNGVEPQCVGLPCS